MKIESILRVLLVFGTRPEALKCAPVVLAARQNPNIEVKVCVTGQHRSMLDQVLGLFGIQPDYDLDIMTKNQTLSDVTSRVLHGLTDVLDETQPDFVLVQGDTTTAMTAALAAFYKKIPVGHIEAGLRTGDIYSPWPEEMNRRLVGELATIHFAPTAEAKQNLISVSKNPETIIQTGNTVVDSLLEVCKRIDEDSPLSSSLQQQFDFLRPDRRMILVTGHRRENFDGGIERICDALSQLAKRPDIDIVYPIHPNPNVSGPVSQALAKVENIFLLPPLDYLPFVYLMKQSHIILTDSGGIQEEAPSLGKPVLVMRENTERPEGVAAGTAKLVGTDIKRIVGSAMALLDDEAEYARMSQAHNPYGDGMASERILTALENHA